MVRRPPISTLFPTRRSSDLNNEAEYHALIEGLKAVSDWKPDTRSEEHTSELQSQSNLVCRLLLEKKKESPSIARAVYATSSPYTTVIADVMRIASFTHAIRN